MALTEHCRAGTLKPPSSKDALQLVHLYAERGSPKFEPAARRWLVRYLSEGTPSLRDVAKVTASLAERELEAGRAELLGASSTRLDRLRTDVPSRATYGRT